MKKKAQKKSLSIDCMNYFHQNNILIMLDLIKSCYTKHSYFLKVFIISFYVIKIEEKKMSKH